MKDTRQPHTKVILITGCATGVGHATALACVRAGYITYATGRNLKELRDLAAAGCHTLELDVTSENSRVQAVQAILAKHKTIDILVNNAGYGQMGAIELISLDQIRRQFETNVFGVLRLCQLVMPRMRQSGKGTIVIVGSMGGLVTTPFMGAYHMSKYAVESLADALRREASGFGIRTILLEPEAIKSNFGNTTLASVSRGDTPYTETQKRISQITAKSYMSPRLLTPERVADKIIKVTASKHPKARYRIGVQAHIMPALFHIMGDRLTDKLWHNIIKPKNG